MNKEELIEQIKKKRSFLCVGLDSDLNKIPSHLLKYKDPIFEFNKRIIDSTKDLCVAYKPNIAFYESLGADGWSALDKTLDYIPDDIFTIADAKRGDVGHTSNMYAKAFFERMKFSAVTISPYMGSDSVKPFLSFKDKWAIVLVLTSNASGLEFQRFKNCDGKELFKEVLDMSQKWGDHQNIMYVVGATRSQDLRSIREVVPEHFLLVPGVGAQGGDLDDVARYGMNSDCGLLVNSSRSIIYSSSGIDFADKARISAETIQKKMDVLLSNAGI